MSPELKPLTVHVRMYRVGFGDGFLVSFDYGQKLKTGRKTAHMLVDCGSTRTDRRGPSMEDLAAQISADCGGKLDVLVVTHRHSDHLSIWNSDKTAKVMDKLKPDLVVRPWTDDPAALPEASEPAKLDDGSRRFAAALRSGQEAAELIGHALRRDSRSLAGELGLLALGQVPNLAAVDRLEGYAKAAQGVYPAFGGDSRIPEFIPGITVDVLGPPTVKQWPDVTRQRSSDPDEFWMLTKRLVEVGFTEEGIDPEDPTRWAVLLGEDRIGPARWLLERLDEQRVGSLLRIVRSFDDALNNTSLILLIEAGDRRLLFPGDAQIENWSFALSGAKDPQLIERLCEVDVYKVGHHGSRNATPRTLFGLWTDPKRNDRPMTALMSTLPGVHGKRPSTAVPRETLVEALGRRTQLFDTSALPEGATHVHIAAATDRGEAFEQAG